MESELLEVEAGFLLHLVPAGLIAATLLTIFVLRARRARRAGRGKQEKIGGAADDLEEINSNLQTDLKNQIVERINQVKADMKARKLQRDQNVSDLLKEQEMEISEKRSEFEVAKEVIEYKYREKIEALKEEVKTEISEMKESLKSLRIILSSSPSLSTTETLTNTRSELECPVCLEEMRPPRRWAADFSCCCKSFMTRSYSSFDTGFGSVATATRYAIFAGENQPSPAVQHAGITI